MEVSVIGFQKLKITTDLKTSNFLQPACSASFSLSNNSYHFPTEYRLLR